MSSRNILAIDLGGTSAKCAVFTENKELLIEFKVKTDKNRVLENIKEYVDAVFEHNKISWDTIWGIGFALPGFLDDKEGIVRLAGNLNWKEFNIRKEAQTIFKKDVFIINDANAAGLGELWLRTDDVESIIMYTLGTGIGGAVILNNELWIGKNGFAGELGHGGYLQSQYDCTCGLKNCLEALSSATGITKELNRYADENPHSKLHALKQSLKKDIRLKDIVELFANDEQEVIDVITTCLEPLANHIVMSLYMLNVEEIILSGGPTKLGDKLLNIIDKLVRSKVGEFMQDTFIIKISHLQDKAGMYGAAYYAFKNIDKDLKSIVLGG